MNSPTPSCSPGAGHDAILPSLRLAMQEVFELMLACPLESCPEVPEDKGLEITSIVGLAGHRGGVLTMRCSAESAARMASRMLGIDPDKAGPAMWDAAGEVCNMLAGNFKNKINGLAECTLSVPTVITGAHYNLSSDSGGCVQAAFLFEGEPIIVSVEIH